jgi:hypothetical protein
MSLGMRNHKSVMCIAVVKTRVIFVTAANFIACFSVRDYENFGHIRSQMRLDEASVVISQKK